MKKKIITLMLFSLLGLSHSYSQENLPIRYDTTPIEGHWIAQNGIYTYEMTLKRQWVFFEPANARMEMLLGSFTFKKNGVIIRQVGISDFDSMVSVKKYVSSHGYLMNYVNSDKQIVGEGFFKINPDNPSKATWQLSKNSMQTSFRDWNGTELGIPPITEWTKIN